MCSDTMSDAPPKRSAVQPNGAQETATELESKKKKMGFFDSLHTATTGMPHGAAAC